MEDDEKFPFWKDKIDDEDETFPKESDFLLHYRYFIIFGAAGASLEI